MWSSFCFTDEFLPLQQDDGAGATAAGSARPRNCFYINSVKSCGRAVTGRVSELPPVISGLLTSCLVCRMRQQTVSQRSASITVNGFCLSPLEPQPTVAFVLD